MGKIKNNPQKLMDYRAKQRELSRKYRIKLRENPIEVDSKLKRKREYDRSRVKMIRANRQVENKKSDRYWSKQSLGKAVKKAERALPKNAERRKIVLDVLNKKYNEDKNIIAAQETRCNQNQLDVAKKFYLKDEISVQAAERKKTIIVDGQLVARRYMLMTIAEAFELYKTEIGTSAIGKTIFYQQRPRHIELSSKMPYNMCVCMYHANFAFLLESCATVFKCFSSDFESFLRTVCCNIEGEECMTGNCQNCVHDIKHEFVPLIYWKYLEECVNWQNWRKVDGQMVLTKTLAPLHILLNELQAELPIFKEHFFVKRCQQKYFEDVKAKLKPGEIVLQIDFAENYRLQCQNEIQSAHFSYKQVTIFTCVAWLHGSTKSYAVISENLNHDKNAVFTFISKIMDIMKMEYELFKKVYIFSDGSSSQFKNKYITWSLPDFLVHFGCEELEWNYFATSHGKGAVDGVGAVVKRKVWQIQKTKKDALQNAFSFYECARHNISGVNLCFISTDDIAKVSEKMNAKWETAKNISGIKRKHFTSCNTEMKIKIARTAYSQKCCIN